jgi:predicted outer membrane protein
VAIAKFAGDKSKNDDVRKFAKMLVSDHADFLKKLQQFAPEATRDGFLEQANAGNPNGAANNANAARPNAKSQTAAKPPLDGAPQAGIDMLGLHRELAEQCLADSKAMLSKKDSDEFDECFVGFQIAKHAAMKTKLTVFERHASGELRDLFAAALKTTSDHLDHAEKLMKKLADSSESTASK